MFRSFKKVFFFVINYNFSSFQKSISKREQKALLVVLTVSFFQYNIKKKDDPALAPPAPGRVGRGQFSPMPVKDEDDVDLTMENLNAENVGKKANFLFKTAKTSVMGMFGGGE